MTETQAASPAQPRSLGRSVLAILVGFVFVVLLSIVTDAVFHKLGVFPPLGEYTADRPLLLATFYRIIYGVIGSYITARLALRNPCSTRWSVALSGSRSAFSAPPSPGTRISALTGIPSLSSS